MATDPNQPNRPGLTPEALGLLADILAPDSPYTIEDVRALVDLARSLRAETDEGGE